MKKELEELVVNNLGLVYDVVNKYKTGILKLFEYDDAIQIGMLGLINAAMTFDNTKQIAFSTYAYACIQRNIFREIIAAKRQKRYFNNCTISLDAVLVENDEFTLMDYLQSDVNVNEQVADNDLVDLLYKYIDELDDELQQQIVLLRLQDKTFKQIAETLNKSQDTIYATFQRALNRLRNKFRQHRGD